MHETARHAIHSSETLNVSTEMLEAMQQQVIYLSTKYKRGKEERAEASHSIQRHIDSQFRMLRSLFLRSQSNKERLQNEITLVRANTLAAREAGTYTSPDIQSDCPAR
jgi:hypothetical protein